MSSVADQSRADQSRALRRRCLWSWPVWLSGLRLAVFDRPSPRPHAGTMCNDPQASRLRSFHSTFWYSTNAVDELRGMLAAQRAAVLAARDVANHSALNIAAFHGSAEGVRMLCGAGAAASNPDVNRHTPLHHAVLGKTRPETRAAAVSALLAAGADPHARDVSGKTPLDYVKGKRDSARQQVAALLQAATATATSAARRRATDGGSTPGASGSARMPTSAGAGRKRRPLAAS